MRIAVATDFSEQAEHARVAAVALARRTGAAVTLIHAVEPESPAAEDPERARSALRALAGAIGGQGVSVAVEIVRGYAEEIVASTALQMGADLLVVGTHGRRAPLRWFVGSVAERTLQTSELPVLVVAGEPGAFAAWADGTRPLRVTAALESAEPDVTIFDVARLLRRAGGCELTFVHVAARGLLGERLRRLLERAFAVRSAEFGGRVELVADGESLANAVAAFLAHHPSDLTVVGIHPRAGFELPRTAELARSLLRRHCGPVLAAPLPRAAPHAGKALGFESILVPTDLSDVGNRAVAHAYALARAGSVTLFHVVGPLDAQRRLELELRLFTLVPAGAAARAIATNVVIVEGARPSQAIVDTATRLGCSLICMGSHGRSRLGRIMLGSVVEEVLHRFPRAVLIVR